MIIFEMGGGIIFEMGGGGILQCGLVMVMV